MTPELLDLIAQLGALDPAALLSFALAGIFGGSSKSKSTINTNQEDRRIAATDSAIVAGENSTVNLDVDSADPAVIQAALSHAFGFGRAASNSAERTTERALAHNARAVVESLDFGERAIQEALDFGGVAFDFGGEALELTERALDRTQSGFQQGLEQQADLIERTVARGSEDLQGLKGLLTTTAIIAVGAFALIGFRK